VQYQNAFASLGTSEELSDETIFILGKVTYVKSTPKEEDRLQRQQ
jgi:hypothetical protein